MPAPIPHRIDPPSHPVPGRSTPVPVAPATAGATRRSAFIEQRVGRHSPGGSSTQAAESKPDGGPHSAGGAPSTSSPGQEHQLRAGVTAPHNTDPDWLQLHATELIERLQSWASDLDAREAGLNARLSVQDHRERRFRLLQQDIEAQLAEQQRSIERLQQENLAQARRLAFQDE